MKIRFQQRGVVETFYIGRQPILDKNSMLYGYELLFRDSRQNIANITDTNYAISRTILNIIDKFGIENILNKVKGFLNITEEFLFNDFIESMDKNKFVFEILETCKVDKKFTDRVRDLRLKGYRFALDDLVFDEGYINNFKPIFEFMDIIKVDVRENSKYELIKKTRTLKSLRTKLLAEKVETYDEFLFTRDLGYELFQGYYFEKPSVFEKKGHSAKRTIIFKIISEINKNASISTIADYFELDPTLTLSLLKFINSAAFYLRTQVTSIVHAINMIGLIKLQNWLLIMSYAEGESSDISPLFQASVLRGKIIEFLLGNYTKNQIFIDKGFLTGIVSVADIIYKTKMEELLKELNLDEEITDAILHRKGLLGSLLTLVELDEKNDYLNFTNKLLELNISHDLYNNAKISSLIWLNTLLQSL